MLRVPPIYSSRTLAPKWHRPGDNPLFKKVQLTVALSKRKKKIHQNQLASDCYECLPFTRFFTFSVSALKKKKVRRILY